MERYNDAKKVSIMGIIVNLFLFIIKIFIAIASKSQGLLADSINSASDIFTSLMTFIGNKLASKPKDNDHPYGHGKVEYVFSLIISLCMIVLAFTIFKDSILSIINSNHLIFSNSLIWVCSITIVMKLILYIITKKIGNKNENLLIVAMAEDHRNDIFLTLSTLAGIIACKFGIYFLDGIVGIAISLWIGYVAIKLFTLAYDVLIDTDISDSIKESINNIVKKQNNCKIDNLKSIPTGINYIIIIEIILDGNISLNEAHNISDKISKKICKLDKIVDCIVHINPGK